MKTSMIQFSLCLLVCTVTFGSVSSENPELFNKARELYARGEYYKASDVLTSINPSSPEDKAELLLFRAKCLLKQQNWKGAVKQLERATKLQPSNSLYHLWLGRAYGERAFRVIFFRAFSFAHKVRKEFETAVKLSPEDLDVRFDLMEFYMQAPGMIGGGMNKARAQARKISRISPRHGFPARAELLAKEKKFGLAREELEKAIAAYPSEPGTYMDLADFLYQQSDFAGAEANALKALEINPDSARAKLRLSSSLVRQNKNLEQVEKVLNELTFGPFYDDEDPSFAEVYYWLGMSRLTQGERSRARTALQKALEFDPDYKEAKKAIRKTR